MKQTILNIPFDYVKSKSVALGLGTLTETNMTNGVVTRFKGDRKRSISRTTFSFRSYISGTIYDPVYILTFQEI